jgi:hypothetical protein
MASAPTSAASPVSALSGSLVMWLKKATVPAVLHASSVPGFGQLAIAGVIKVSDVAIPKIIFLVLRLKFLSF